MMSGTQSSINTRQELIGYTTSEWNTFVTYIDGLTGEQWTAPEDPAGWSVKDHVSHVTRWDIAMIELFDNTVPMRQTLGISEADWTLDDYDPMNEQIRQRTINDSIATVRTDRDVTWIALVSALDALSDEQLAAPPAEAGLNAGDESASSLLHELVGYLGGHYAEHLGYIKVIVEGAAE